MHIRCKKCHGTIWVEPPGATEDAPAIRCKKCAQEYVLDGSESLRAGERRLAMDARKIAEEHGVDLPGAYSVLFGIMKPEEVLELAGGGSAKAQTPPPAPPLASPLALAPAPAPEAETVHPEVRLTYDRAFQTSIDAGLLSVQEATARGQRTAYAETLVLRHGFSIELALDIADNKTTLLNCLRARTNDDSAEIVARVPAGPRRYALGALAGLAIAVSTALVIAYASPAVPLQTARTVKLQGAEVRIDEHGRIVRVAAPDPRTVLNGFCASRPDSGGMEAIAVVPSKQSGRECRLGLFRPRNDKSHVLMIEILENRAAGHWAAGDGVNPIVPKNAPPSALAEDPPTGSPG